MGGERLKLSIVFGFRNRDALRVKRCLDSLSDQTQSNFKVCFVDYGSDEEVQEEIKPLVQSYSFCKYVYVPTQGNFWNRSHALNIGVRASTPSEYVLTTDVDLIFPHNFIERMLGILSPEKEIHFSARDLPSGFSQWAQLNRGKKFGEMRPNTALGLVQGVHRSKFEAIGGFDEFYCIWGVEDEDLSERLTASGITTEWVDFEDCTLYHQWHPTSGRRNFKLPGRWQEFLVKYKEGNGSIERNHGNWGVFKPNRNLPEAFAESEELHKVDLNNVPAQFVPLKIKEVIDELKGGETATFLFRDLLSSQLKTSRLVKVIRKINCFLDRQNSGLMLTNDLAYYRKHQSVYDYRDAISYFILYNRDRFQDYFFQLKDDSLEFIVEK